MWIKKSEWEDMKKQVGALKKIHNHDNETDIENGFLPCLPKCAQYYFDHTNITNQIVKMMFQIIDYKLTHIVDNQLNNINTNTIPDLTLEELARYVIDGKPIKRKKEIDVEYRGE